MQLKPLIARRREPIEAEQVSHPIRRVLISLIELQDDREERRAFIAIGINDGWLSQEEADRIEDK